MTATTGLGWLAPVGCSEDPEQEAAKTAKRKWIARKSDHHPARILQTFNPFFASDYFTFFFAVFRGSVFFSFSISAAGRFMRSRTRLSTTPGSARVEMSPS
jgi:hypothetical protein